MFFGVQSIKFMGEIISNNSIQTDPDKVSAILNLTAGTPTYKKDLQKFLGMVNYLAGFIPKLSDLTDILRNLLRKSSQ